MKHSASHTNLHLVGIHSRENDVSEATVASGADKTLNEGDVCLCNRRRLVIDRRAARSEKEKCKANATQKKDRDDQPLIHAREPNSLLFLDAL